MSIERLVVVSRTSSLHRHQMRLSTIPEEQPKLRRSLDQLIDYVIMKQETNVEEERDSGNNSDEDVKPAVPFKKGQGRALRSALSIS